MNIVFKVIIISVFTLRYIIVINNELVAIDVRNIIIQNRLTKCVLHAYELIFILYVTIF